jgi:hypothetical protein
MTDLKELLSEAWVNGLFGLIGGLLGILGIVLFFAARSRSRVGAQINSLELVGMNSVLPNEIEFLFRGNKVPKVTLSRIAIWNIGNTTLKGDQIVAGDPLRVVTSDDSEILEATILSRTRQVNEFSCNRHEDLLNEATCQFDYLDPQDGALVQLIHTGTDKVQVVGTLRGIRKRVFVRSVNKKAETKKPDVGSGSPSGVRIIGAGFILFGLSVALLRLIIPPMHPDTLPTDVAVFFGGVFIVIGILFYSLASYMPPKILSTQITTIDPKKRSGFGLFGK